MRDVDISLVDAVNRGNLLLWILGFWICLSKKSLITTFYTLF